MAESKSYDLGRSLKREGASPVFDGEDAPHQVYPGLGLSSTEFPPLKAWQVGKTYPLTVQVKMTGMHERGKRIEGEFDVLSAKV